MKTTYLALVLPFLAGGCVLDFGPKVWVEETTDFAVPLDGLRATSCRVHNGSILVHGGATDEIRVSVTKRGGGQDEADAALALDNIALTKEIKDGTLHLGWEWREDRQQGWGASVSYTIVQPPELSVAASTHNGKVEVGGVTANCSVRTHNGHLKVIGSRGDVAARAHNGRIQVRGCRGTLSARTHNGGIHASGRPRTVALRTHNGGITAEVANHVGVTGTLQTHNGGITVEVGEETPIRVECKGRGRLRADGRFDRVHKSRRRLTVEHGDPRGKLTVRTHNGSIRIK